MLKVLGITDDRTDCDCCGKVNLKCTVALERESGELVYFGRHCAALAVHGSKSARNVSRIESAALQAMQEAEHNRKSKLARIADDRPVTCIVDGKAMPIGFTDPKCKANYLYNRTQRPLPGSYFATRGDQIVRVDGNDQIDVQFYATEGFMPTGIVAGSI